MIRSAASMRAGAALLIIALCCAAPPCSRAEDLLVLPGLPGGASIGADTLDTRSLIAGIRWSGLDLRDLGGKLEGACIGMEAAVLRGRYDVRCDLSAAGDSACSSDLFICDEIAISGIRLSAGTIQSVSSTAVVERGPLTLLLKPDVGCRVRLSRVSISPADASGGVSLGSLSPAAADGLPRNRPLARSSRTCLREACEHLVRHQVSTGLFDYRTAAWRDASYSVRALLAGYEILGDRTYLEAARRTILAFLSEQRPDGGWCPFCRAQEPDLSCDENRPSDLGEMTACLSIAAPHLDAEETDRCVAAHRRYADSRMVGHGSVSRRAALPAGRVPSEAGAAAAAAAHAMSLAALYHATGEAGYLREAEQMAWPLLVEWQSNGRPPASAGDRVHPSSLDAMRAADVYPLLEGLLWVRRATDDPILRDAVRMTIHSYLHGAEGLLAGLEDKWFPATGEAADVTMSCGMLAVLVEARVLLGRDETIDRLIARGSTLLCADEARQGYGILVPPYSEPSNRAILNTSLAGLSFAQRLRPGIVFGGERPAGE